MIIKTISPGKPLQDYVKCYWTFHHNGLTHTERLFPVGEPQIIFHLGEPFIETDPIGETLNQPDAVVSGQLTTFKNVTANTGAELFGISLQPHALRTLLKVPAYILTDHSIGLKNIDREYIELHERILEARNTEDRVNITESYLLDKILRSNTKEYKLVHGLLERMEQPGLSTHVPSPIAKIGQRQLERIFLEHVGVSARLFQKIAKFTKALQLLPSSASLTSIGYESGYFDQAHFSRSFKKMTGYSPKDYRQKVRN